MSKINQELVELLEHPVDVKRLVDRLFFSADDLETAALKQPKLFLETGKFRAQSALRVAKLKRRLGRVSAEAAIKVRSKGDKTTESAVKNSLAMNHKVQHAQRLLDQAEVYDDFSKQLSEAYKERIMVIAILARLKAAEVNSHLREAQSEETISRMSKKARAVRNRFDGLDTEDDI